MNKKQKKNLIRIIIAAALLIILHFLPLEGWVRFACYLVPYIIIGYDIIIKAVKGIIHGQPFDENLLMSIASIGAIILAVYRSGDYVEAIAVMLFYQIGEWFQSYAVGRSRRNISDLMDIRPDYANIEVDGNIEQVDPDEVEIGTIIVVRPGEKVPIDGIIREGTTVLNTSALTGESVPRDAGVGDEVLSGCINESGLIRVETTKEFDESTASKILDLVENASSRKSRSENFITKFARVYTPIVVFCAIALALIPPLVLMFILRADPMWGDWIYRALTFLIISCPCALVISIPLSFFAGIGGASREGVLVKGSNYLEILSQVNTVVFDKTGTLTQGVFKVSLIHPEDIPERELLHMAAHVERYSKHPIAVSLKQAYPEENSDDCVVEDAEEIAGHGIRSVINGHVVCAGNTKLMDMVGADWHDCEESGAGTMIHVAVDGKYAGHIVISDVVKPTSAEAVRKLHASGVTKTVMLTGDAKAVADTVAAGLKLDEVYSELLPADKVSKVEELLAEQGPNDKLAFVGDGINDAPVLSRADIGIAMGAMGSDAAIEAADVVLMDDDPMKISKAVRISRKCLRIVKQNIFIAIAIKILCLALGAMGFATMWMAIIADVGVMIIAVLNAIRCLFVKKL